MKTLNFVTSNPWKIEMFNQFVHELSDEINIEMLNLEFDELKLDDSLEQTALNKARTCMKLTNKDNVIVSDIWLFLEWLNWFPWINIAYAMRTIWNEWIIKLMEWVKNRKALYKCALAYKDKRWIEKVFVAETDIEIATDIAWNLWMCWDKIAFWDWERFSDNLTNEKRVYPYKESIRLMVAYVNSLED